MNEMDRILAVGLGVLQGFLAIPTWAVQGALRERFRRHAGGGRVMDVLGTVAIVLFLVLIHGAVAAAWLDVFTPARAFFRKQAWELWALGTFAGVVAYTAIPYLERARWWGGSHRSRAKR